ncbi:S8 family peptidase [Massilia sp. 9096]|uniref:S8 family peptidase n=1 Tax=Massilia sp. 9096 TaxID=1500894 RepID=UPI0005641E53|nr:S8 family peptidase [Massilia sp. 9096]
MTQRHTSLIVSALMGALLAAGPLAMAHAGQQDGNKTPHFITQTDRLIVKYKDAAQGVDVNAVDGKIVPPAAAAANLAVIPAARQAILDRAGQQFGATLRALRATAGGAHVFQLNHTMTLDQARQLAAELKARDSNVEYAEPDRIMTAQATPTDPSYGQQWDLFESAGGINAPAAWDRSTGAGVNVAVIDTGYRPHADLADQILQGYDFITNTTIANDGNGRDSDASDPGDWTTAGQCAAGVPAADENSSWHGTHVAGTIAAKANNGIGVAGIAWNAKIVPARVLGKCGGYTSDIADAMIWASGGSVSGVPANANVARVLNLSLGGSGACDTTTQNAINSARSRGAVVVVAAGNSNTEASTSSPANCAGVIAVAATGRTGGKASYSNTGSIVTIAAPGGDNGAGILSTLNAGTTTPGADSYAYYMGTSMATPHVAGVVALMLSANPNLTPDDVAAKLKSTARAFPAACPGCGAGIVDAGAAVNAALGGASTTPAPAPAPVAPTIAETESNNTVTTANKIATSGTIVNGTIANSADTDYFVVQLPAGKTLSATLSPNASSDYDLYIYNAAGTRLAYSAKDGNGVVEAASTANTGTTAAARYVRVVYYRGGTGATNGKYSLKLAW